MKKTNLADKEKNLITALLGILFLVIAWFIVASPLRERTSVLKEENKTLQEKTQIYQGIYANLDSYESQIVTLEDTKKKIYDEYPIEITREDEIMFWANLENKFPEDISVSTLTMSAMEEVSPATSDTQNTDSATDQTSGDSDEALSETQKADGMTAENETDPQSIDDSAQTVTNSSKILLYRAPIDFNFVTTYSGLKDMLTYMFSEGTKKSVDAINLSFDSATGNLSGTMTMNLYYMIGIDKQYQPLQIPPVQKGVKDIFHTVNSGIQSNDSNQESVENESDQESAQNDSVNSDMDAEGENAGEENGDNTRQ